MPATIAEPAPLPDIIEADELASTADSTTQAIRNLICGAELALEDLRDLGHVYGGTREMLRLGIRQGNEILRGRK